MNHGNLKSVVEGAAWPAVLKSGDSCLLSILFQLEQSQWWAPEKILESQFQQLRNVWQHAFTTVPYYQKKFSAAGFKKDQAIDAEEWRRVPILIRSAVQENEKELLSRSPLRSHGKICRIRTSGSTGRTINICGTWVTSLFWSAMTMRDHFWHKRNFSGKLAVIRHRDNIVAPYPGERYGNWGPPAASLYDTGPSAFLSSSTDIAMQAQWLQEENPDYILSYPSNLRALADYFLKNNKKLANLRQVRTLGEIVGAGVREACRRAWDVQLADMYSAQEVGYIALQCPEVENNYHVQSESLLVEVVDKNGNPCKEGETGRVLLTTLHNFATPLIRYEIGDYATVGSCACGRGLPVLAGIRGRQRNMLHIPDGRQTWPTFGMHTIGALPIEQFQFVQKRLDSIEARLVCASPLTKKQEEALVDTLCKRMDYPFKIAIKYLKEIPRSKGGKFEDFMSEIS